MTYPIHPIAKIYPPLSDQEFALLKESIQLDGLENEIVLYEDQVLEGAHRQRVCEALGIPPRYSRPKIEDPIRYVIRHNEGRRQLTKGQLAVIGKKIAKMKIGRPTELGKTVSEVARSLGTSAANIERVRYAEKHGIAELIPAIENGKITVWNAKDIAHLPKAEQPAALEAVITKPKSSRRPKRPKSELTPEEAAKDAACLEYINRPSIFPEDAHIPQGDGVDEVRLRQAIAWLREHESLIATFSQGKCDELLRCTNALASYEDNWFHRPRLDGQFDPRIMEWQQTLWRKRLRQEERIDLQKKLRHRSQPKLAPVRRKVRLPFEDRFDIFWSIIESNLKTFKASEQRAIVKLFRQKLQEFFSDISAGENESCRVASNSNGTTEITAITQGTK